MVIKKTFLFILLSLLIGGSAMAAEYYVAKDGNDGNSGTFANPWLTIKKATDTVIAGDTVYVRAGRYIERVKINTSGNINDGYITFSTYNGEEVIVTDRQPDGGRLPSGYEDEVIIWTRGQSYIKIIGFHVDDHKGNGIRIDGPGEYIEVRDCIISNQEGSTNVPDGQMHALILFAWLEHSGRLDHIIVDNCELYDNITGFVGGGYNETFTIFGEVTNYQVTNNYLHGNYFIGNDYIGQPFYDPSGSSPSRFGIPQKGLIKGNVYEDNGHKGGGNTWAAGLYADGAGMSLAYDDTRVEENISFNNRYCGIEVGDEHRGETSDGWTLVRNICYGNQFGILVGGTGTVAYTKIYNNVFYEDSQTEIIIYGPTAPNAQFRNNVFYNTSAFGWIYWEGGANSSITSDYNVWWPAGRTFSWAGVDYYGLASFQSETGQDAHSKEVDPKFVAPPAPIGNGFYSKVADFRLQPDSPCINAGIDVGLPYNGSAPDIGAYEYIESGTPQAPTGLKVVKAE